MERDFLLARHQKRFAVAALIFGPHTVDCGHSGGFDARDQVHNLVIRVQPAGSYNTTDS